MFHKSLESGDAGDNVGCLLRGLKRDDVQRGQVLRGPVPVPPVPVPVHVRRPALPNVVDSTVSQVLCKPGLLKPSKKFEASVYALTKEEGGRHTPFFTNYRPQLFFRTADVCDRVPSPDRAFPPATSPAV